MYVCILLYISHSLGVGKIAFWWSYFTGQPQKGIFFVPTKYEETCERSRVESNSDWDGKVAQSAEDLLGFSHWARTADKPCFGSLMKVVFFFGVGATSMDRSYESYINYIYICICVLREVISKHEQYIQQKVSQTWLRGEPTWKTVRASQCFVYFLSLRNRPLGRTIFR